MKGQAKIVSVLLIVLIATVAMATVLPWTYNMVQKKQDMKSVDDVYNFFQTLDDTIRNIAQNGGEESLQLKVPGKFTINPHDGAVGVWHFSEDEGCTVNDESLNGNDGTLSPTCSDLTWTNGKSGSGLEFDGVVDYVDCGDDASLVITNEITVEAWVKGYTQPDGGNNEHLVAKQDSYGLCWDHMDSRVDTSFWIKDTTGTWIPTNSIPNPPANEWHHLVGVYNGTYLILYVDGFEASSKNVGTLTIESNDNHLIIGAARSYTAFFNGIIDEVAVYNRALSPEEIYNHYKHGMSINTIRFSFVSKVSNVAEGDWIPLNTPNSYDVGTLGVDSPSVIFAKAEKDADEIEVQNRLWYRELEDQSGHGYRIILNTSNNEIVDTTTGFMRIQRLQSREILTESLTITEINIIV